MTLTKTPNNVTLPL